MPSYTIHLAVAKKYLEHHKEEDENAFYQGVIAPDLKEKPASHFGKSSSRPDLKAYKEIVGLNSSYDRGYYLHLLTDKLFYRKYLAEGEFSKEIYNDYDKINRSIIEAYQLKIPDEVKNKIFFMPGEPKIIRKDIMKFIDWVGEMDLEKE
ncbi:MAG: hypothetical protein J6A75_02605 [Lachnospiraceae bacterium]|nr:hypothetical protein [Lachnospiraceae bacterium]